jgi:hypothetical protein
MGFREAPEIYDIVFINNIPASAMFSFKALIIIVTFMMKSLLQKIIKSLNF